MTVTIKLNNLIWLLTGRSTGFVYPMLNTFIGVPKVVDPRVTAARELLKLDVQGIDFYTFGALSALYSSLYYLRDLDVEHQAAFIPGVMSLPYRSQHVYQRDADGNIVYTGSIPQTAANSNSWTILPFYGDSNVSVINNPINWDAPHDSLHLLWDEPLGGPTITVTKYWLGTPGESQTFFVGLPDPFTNLDAYEFAGIRAGFSVSSMETFVNAPPTQYPYGLVRSRIANESALLSLMLDMDTIGAFHEASSDMVAVGALAAAIVRRAKQVTAGIDYEVQLDEELVPLVPAEMQLLIKFDGTAVDTPCNE